MLAPRRKSSISAQPRCSPCVRRACQTTEKAAFHLSLSLSLSHTISLYLSLLNSSKKAPPGIRTKHPAAQNALKSNSICRPRSASWNEIEFNVKIMENFKIHSYYKWEFHVIQHKLNYYFTSILSYALTSNHLLSESLYHIRFCSIHLIVSPKPWPKPNGKPKSLSDCNRSCRIKNWIPGDTLWSCGLCRDNRPSPGPSHLSAPSRSTENRKDFFEIPPILTVWIRYQWTINKWTRTESPSSSSIFVAYSLVVISGALKPPTWAPDAYIY